MWLLAYLWIRGATNNWVAEVFTTFLGAAGGLGCAKRSRCGYSGGPASRDGGFSLLQKPTRGHKFASPASFMWNMPRRGGQTLQNELRNIILHKTRLAIISFFEFPSSEKKNACMVVTFRQTRHKLTSPPEKLK